MIMAFQLANTEVVALNRVLSGYDAELHHGHEIELECRIGSFDPYGFHPGVSEHTFGRLLDFHRGHYETSYAEFQRHLFHNGSRMDVFPATDFGHQRRVFSQKNNIDKVDLNEYGLRIAIAFEQPLTESFLGNPECVRTIRRHSFMLSPTMRLDMSAVTTRHQNNHIPDESNFEIELEWLPTERLDPEWRYLFMFACEKLVSYVQNANFIYKASELTQAKKNLVSLMATRRIGHCFGAQPRTLQQEDMPAIFSRGYAIGDKTDGVRGYLWIVPDAVFLMYRDTHEPDGVRMFCIGKPANPRTKLADFTWTLVEGEFSEQLGFLAFDLLIHKGSDLRGNMAWTLPHRLSAAKEAVDAINENAGCVVAMKELTLLEAGDLDGWRNTTQRFLDVEFPPEGLIFTPRDECYPLGPNIENPSRSRIWSTLLKWKPVETLTIDFRVVSQGPDPGLYVLLKGTEIPFRPECYQTAYQWQNIDEGSCELNHGTIVEFRVFLVDHLLRFSPVRARLDKETPNAMHVALDNLHAILNPVTVDMVSWRDLSALNRGDLHGEKRIDKCWLSLQEFVAYTTATLGATDTSDAQFPNIVQPICIPVAPVPAPAPSAHESEDAPIHSIKRVQFSEEDFMKLRVEELRHIARMYQLSTRGLRDELRQRLRNEGAVRSDATPNPGDVVQPDFVEYVP